MTEEKKLDAPVDVPSEDLPVNARRIFGFGLASLLLLKFFPRSRSRRVELKPASKSVARATNLTGQLDSKNRTA